MYSIHRLFCCGSDWGITFGVSGDPGWAAGSRGRPADQWCGGDASNEADTAQPPSSQTPKRFVLCMKHHNRSTPVYPPIQPNLPLIWCFFKCVVVSFIICCVKAKWGLVVAELGHYIQTQPLSALLRLPPSVWWMPLCCFPGAAQLRWRGGQKIPAECSWPARKNRTMIWGWCSMHRTPSSSPPCPSFFCFSVFFSLNWKSFCSGALDRVRVNRSNWKQVSIYRGGTTSTAICDLTHFHILPPPPIATPEPWGGKRSRFRGSLMNATDRLVMMKWAGVQILTKLLANILNWCSQEKMQCSLSFSPVIQPLEKPLRPNCSLWVFMDGEKKIKPCWRKVIWQMDACIAYCS